MTSDHSHSDSPLASPESAPSPATAPDCVSREDFAVFAHELRGALTVISGYTEMLRRPLPEDDRLAALEGIRRAIGRADTLCTEVLEARPSRTSPEQTRERVDVRSLAEQVAEEQRAACGRDIAVEATAAPIVLGDEQALARALANLVSNAVKYSPAPAPVRIAVSSEQSAGAGRTAVIEVCDSGPGIPADARERVFDPFERLGRTADTPGTGLGLTVVAGVVSAHGGATRILENPGGGTIVRIELPAAG